MDREPAGENIPEDKEVTQPYDIQILSHLEFGDIRTIRINEELWFNGKDVTRALKMKRQSSNSAIKHHVNPEDIRYAKFPTNGGLQTMAIINKLGLVALVFGSEMKSKQEFKEWILSEAVMEKTVICNPIGITKSDGLQDENPDNIQSVNTPDIIQIFDNPEFGNIRTLMINDEPYFVGADVASAIGYDENSIRNALKQHVDDEDKRMCEINTKTGRKNATVINESGLYSLILLSNLPSAKKFKRWVTSEALPTFRKTGFNTASDGTSPVFAESDLEMAKIINSSTSEQLSVIERLLKNAGCSIDWKILDRQETKTLVLMQKGQSKPRHKRPDKIIINGSIDEKQLERLLEIFAKHFDQDIAEKIKITRTLISKYRNGSRAISQERCEEIIAAFAYEEKKQSGEKESTP